MPLTKERAEFRAAHIKKGSVSYDFHLSVEAGTHYSGVSEINFELQSVPNELVVDFKGQDISKILVNQVPIDVKLDEGFIVLDVTKLK